jgi:hypothetical protein
MSTLRSRAQNAQIVPLPGSRPGWYSVKPRNKRSRFLAWMYLRQMLENYNTQRPRVATTHYTRYNLIAISRNK